MTEIESRVSSHYSGPSLLADIKAALKQSGADPDAPGLAQLKAVDEFHTGGLEATDALLDQLDITPRTRVLDIGCGIGGTARHVADRTGAKVHGFDLTSDFVDVARTLSQMTGMSGQTQFDIGSAVDMPVADNGADLALMFHVGMNIADKSKLFDEAARVLAPAGIFALFDVMRASKRELTFPFPWAEAHDFSFVDPPETYLAAAESAGFELISTRDRSDFAKSFFEKVFARMEEQGGPAPVGIHLLMAETGRQKIQNYVTHLHAGDIAPVEMIFRNRD